MQRQQERSNSCQSIQMQPPIQDREFSSGSNHPLPQPMAFDSDNNDEELVKVEEDGEQQMEENVDGAYYCMRCNKNYQLSICPHTQRKQQKKGFRCPQSDCHRSFQAQTSFQRHKLTHQGIKPYECNYDNCDQRFNQKSNLNRHKRIHTNQKPFICQTCCKAFTTTTNLKQHTQVHLQDRDRRKKYICELKGCNKEYLYMCNLKKHKQEHQDPLGDCLVPKKPDFPIFSISIGTCSFRVSYKKSKQHSQMLITYLDGVPNTVKYSLDDFQKVLTDMGGEEKIEDIQMEQPNHVQDLDNRIRSLLQETNNALNIGFELHNDLCPIANLLVKTLVNILGETNLRVFTLIVPQYSVFRQAVNNLMGEIQESD